ncbi:homeobox protein 13-like [Papaver somniferum]|uniref:homeobox protein 13-like n=1 Tax=Papaver somniferum TaxID=3469 RepID=UPI000E7028C2|nr:homeobox protein 13-like [Papaver somniferum]
MVKDKLTCLGLKPEFGVKIYWDLDLIACELDFFDMWRDAKPDQWGYVTLTVEILGSSCVDMGAGISNVSTPKNNNPQFGNSINNSCNKRQRIEKERKDGQGQAGIKIEGHENATMSEPVHHRQYGDQFNYYNPQFAGNNFAHSVLSSPSIQHHQNNYHYQFGGYSGTFHQQHQQQPHQQFEQQPQQHYYMSNNIRNINYIYTKQINKSEQQHQQFEQQQQQHYYMNNNIRNINYIHTKEINKSEDSAPK